MSDRFFLDTNVVVYAAEEVVGPKQDVAGALIRRAIVGRAGVISSQVIQETLNVVLSKWSPKMPPDTAVAYMKSTLLPLCGVYANDELFEQAVIVRTRWQFSFYDSLIVAAAMQARCSTLYTEDLSHGQRLDDLTVINPFLA